MLVVTPPQFEKVNDLQSIPEAYVATPELLNSGNEYTVYRPPQWLEPTLANASSEKPKHFPKRLCILNTTGLIGHRTVVYLSAEVREVLNHYAEV